MACERDLEREKDRPTVAEVDLVESKSSSGDQKDEYFLALYDKWYMRHSELVDEVEDKRSQIKQTELKCDSIQRTNLRLQEECDRLQKTVDQCHSQLHVFCEMEDEVRSMKTKLVEKDQELATKVAQNKADLRSMKNLLLKEYEEKSAKAKSEYNEQVKNLESTLHNEQESKGALEKQLNDTTREKDREIARITMEYESKLSTVEHQKAQLMQQQQQVLNQDVMRKKMQHMKESYERQVAFLKSQIAELESSAQCRPAEESSVRQQQQSPQWQTQQPQDFSFPGSRGQPGPRPRSNRRDSRSLSMSKRSF